MVFRTASAMAALLIGLGGAGGQALAQYYPPAQAYPSQEHPPREPLPSVARVLARTESSRTQSRGSGPSLHDLKEGSFWLYRECRHRAYRSEGT
jgi:hypothetical protein